MLLEIHSHGPEPRKIAKAVQALERGGVIAYPTDTAYGLGCDLMNKKAVDRLYQIKGMPKSQQLAFICADLSEVARYAVVGDYEYRILKQYLPGPYCFILNATREVPKIVQKTRKQVGVRIPNHEVARAIVRELGRPIISTTAVRPDQAPHVDARELDDDFRGLDLVIDCGAGHTQPTSVIDLSGDNPTIIREGAGDVTPFRE